MDVRGKNQENLTARPSELRYRIADFINDCFRAIPFVHAALKWVFVKARRLRRDISSGGSDAHANAQVPSTEVNVGGELTGRLDLLPFPPLEMRELVGPTDRAAFDNADRRLVYPWLPVQAYEKVFDFGCGCGRVARQLMLQQPSPKVYVGIDLHAGMVRWCRANLQPIAPNFQFLHHDVFNVRFNPGPSKPKHLPFSVADSDFTLVNALSVFTHLTQEQAVHYLRECARILRPDGVLHASWFLFDRSDYPMLQSTDAALYVSYVDPSAAVIFDRAWVRTTARQFGLTIYQINAPQVHGHQWLLLLTKKMDVEEAEFPADTAPPASVAPPLGSRSDADKIGMDGN